MALSIRAVVGSDCPYLYEICLKTGFSGKDASDLFYDPLMIGQYYAAPYLFYDPQSCFVVEENAIPKGYIIGTRTSYAFYEWFESKWLPLLRCRYPQTGYVVKSDFEAQLVQTIHRSCLLAGGDTNAVWDEYPAHLHIDLLSDLQGKGCGRKLMDTFCQSLSDSGVPAVHLGVEKQNESAVAFYKKMNFTVIAEESWGFTMGKKL